MSAPEEYRANQPRRPTLYFPVSSERDSAGPYHPIAAGSAGGDSVIESDDEREHYLASKRATLQYEGRGPLRLREAASHDAIERAEAFLRRELTSHLDAKRIATLGLDALMLEIQEDLVVMHRPAGVAAERARAHYLHVCFPSHWPPARMLGKNFLSLHARVPAENSFARGERARHAAKLFEAPAVRFIWSLTPDSRLDHHPDNARTAWTDADEIFLRVERQVILPLTAAAPHRGDVTLFFIRTYVYPVDRLDLARRALLVQAIDEMSPAMRHYKGIAGSEGRIRELLIGDQPISKNASATTCMSVMTINQRRS